MHSMGYCSLIYINIVCNRKGMAQFFGIDVWTLLDKTLKILVKCKFSHDQWWGVAWHTFTSNDVRVLGLPGSKAHLTIDPVDNHNFRMRYTVLTPNLVAWLISLGLMPCSNIVTTSLFCASGIKQKLDIVIILVNEWPCWSRARRELKNRWSSRAGLHHCLPYLDAYVHKGPHKWIWKFSTILQFAGKSGPVWSFAYF